MFTFNSKEMKKFFKLFPAFLLFASALYLVLLMLWGYLSPVKYNLALPTHGFTQLRMEEAKHTRDIDILVLGASHTFRGFDPRIFQAEGFNLFVLGSSNQTHIQTYMLVKRYLEQMNPKVVFYEVSADLFANDGIEAACDLLYNETIDDLSYRMTYATDLGNMKVLNSLLFNQVRQWLRLPHKTFSLRGNNEDDYIYIPGGYVTEEVTRHFHTVNYSDSLRWEFKEKQLNYFSRTLDYLAAHGVKVYLIQAPIAPSFYRAHVNNAEFDRLMEGFGDYYNFNELIHLDDSLHFYDETHLNQIGTSAFNEALIKQLFK